MEGLRGIICVLNTPDVVCKSCIVYEAADKQLSTMRTWNRQNIRTHHASWQRKVPATHASAGIVSQYWGVYNNTMFSTLVYLYGTVRSTSQYTPILKVTLVTNTAAINQNQPHATVFPCQVKVCDEMSSCMPQSFEQPAILTVTQW